MKKFKLGVIGAGFMSNAIVNGAVSSCFIEEKDIIVSDINEESFNKFNKININTTLDNEYLVNNSEYVLLAIKPQSFNEMIDKIKFSNCKVISIMAGVKKEKIKVVFTGSKVARCMPNTPCAIKSGAIAIDSSDYSEENDLSFIKNLFSSLATVSYLPEDKLNVVTGVSGSSPAYFYLFLKGIIDAGVKNGLTFDDAKNLATNTMIGSAKMVLQNDCSLDELINRVCSKGGTTIEAIKVYEDSGLTEITEKAIDACIKRSIELENL